MHEYALMQRVVKTILDDLERSDAGPGAVRTVGLRVGVLEVHDEDSFRHVFQAAVRGTRLEGAGLRLSVAPAALACASCGYRGPCPANHAHHHDPDPCQECPDCGALCPVLGGRGVDAIELELDDDRV
jgi:Zn finger protein HypA/HybF involved in hydrogenase expression